MADEITIEPMSAPWRPSADAKLEKTFNYFDMPLAGVIRQRGVLYLFSCVEGYVANLNLWAYRILPEREADELGNPESIHRSIKLVDESPDTIALAKDGQIFASSSLPPDGRDAYVSLVRSLVRLIDSTPDERSA